MEPGFKQGKWMVQPPYGYRIEDGFLVVEPAEAVVVWRIFARYLGDGLGTKQLARELKCRGPSHAPREFLACVCGASGSDEPGLPGARGLARSGTGGNP